MRENGNRQEMLQKMMASLGTDIRITEDGEERIINKELNNEDISVDHKIALEGFSYTLKVPLSYIASQSNTKSIGISIEGMKRPNSIKHTNQYIQIIIKCIPIGETYKEVVLKRLGV